VSVIFSFSTSFCSFRYFSVIRRPRRTALELT
jgi:hypothetical protein